MEQEQELTTKDLFRKWLEKLQQESWQLELLISGFALYGVYASKSIITELSLYSDKVSNPFFLNVITTFLNVGWKIFFINLLIHVILRSLWIGAIGLRYVSGEIDYQSLNYSEKFTTYLEKKVGDYDDFIEKLERICSVLFSYTFLLFLLFLSAILYLLVGIGPILVLENLNHDRLVKLAPILNLLWIYPYILFSLVVFVDFISLGGLKRVKENFIAKLYMPIYRFFSTITLSFLYRPLIYNFIDDRYTKRLFFLSIPYIMLVTFGHRIVSSKDNPHIANIGTTLSTTGLGISYHNYDDLVKEHREEGSKLMGNRNRIPNVRLNAYYQEDEFNSIFIKTKRDDKEILEKKFGIPTHYAKGLRFSLFNYSKVEEHPEEKIISDKYKELFSTIMSERKELSRSLRRNKSDSDSTTKKYIDSLDLRIDYLSRKKELEIKNFNQSKHEKILQAYMDLFHFSIDGKSYQDSLQCFFTTHANNNEKGLLCHYSTAHLSKGVHIADVSRIYNFEEMKNMRLDTAYYKIPFIKK